MTRSRAFGALLGAALAGAASSASAFSFGNVVTTPCATCPSGRALDIERSYRGQVRWDAHAAVGALGNGLQVTILPGIAEAFGVRDPGLAAQIESAIEAGVLGWSSPVLEFDITLGSLTPETEITIGWGAAAQVGGFVQTTQVYSFQRTLTDGSVVPGSVFTSARIVMNQATLTTMFASVHESLALGALQRLVAHEMGHALGLGHPTDIYEYNVVVDSSGALVTSADAVDDTAIMVPFNNLPRVLVGFDPAMRADDLAGRDVLYPHLPEPGALLLLGVAALAALRAR